MTLDEIRATLADALPLRAPTFGPEVRGANKVAVLESYLLATATHRGALEEALHWLMEMQVELRRQWDAIQGWKENLSSAEARAPTKEQIARAKQPIRPDLWDGMAEAKRLATSVERQIRRLEIDDKAMSRAYTLISGS